MSRRLVLLAVVAVGLLVLYQYALLVTIGYAAAMPMPRWWMDVFPSRLSGTLSFMVLWHTLAVVVAALPIAWVLARFYGRRSGVIAFAIAAVVTLPTELPAIAHIFRAMSVRAKVLTISDYVVLLGTLPLLVWLFKVLPSNHAFERTVTHQVPSSERGRPAAQRER